MAPVQRRPATRNNPSSTQQEVEYPSLQIGEEEVDQSNEQVLTQLEEEDENLDFVVDDSNYSYAPQYDNPSTTLPDFEDDYALKEHMHTQEQLNRHQQDEFQQELEDEFDLDFNQHDEANDNEGNENRNTKATYTQGTLDAASILAEGFIANHHNNNTNPSTNAAADNQFSLPDVNHSDDEDDTDEVVGVPPPLPTRATTEEDAADDIEFMQKYHEYNRRNGIQVNTTDNQRTVHPQAPQLAPQQPTTQKRTPISNSNANLAKQLANCLRKDGISGLSTEEKDHVTKCDEGKNTKKCADTQERLEKRWFDTIKEFGGHLSVLATEEKINPNHTTETDSVDKAFYAVCGGEKNADKHKIFNDCLVCCGMKWYCLTGKNKGKHLQPSAFAKHMEQLTIVFAEKGIRYNFANDFNRKGDFHGVIKTMWRKIRESDPSFGTGADRARTDPALFRKFVEAIRDGTIRPYEEPEHLVLCVIFIFGFYLGLRGSSEHLNLMTEQLYIGEYTMEDGQELAGLRWGGVKVPFSKTKNLKLSNTRLPRDQDVVLSFVEDACPWWDPWHVLCFFIDHCHPRATKVFARVVKLGCDEAESLRNEFGKDIWFCESGKGANWNMGPSKHRSLCREIAKLSGVDKWESCTGHALRALCITHCLSCGLSNAEVAAKVRHASINSSKTYAQETSKRKASRMGVMNPTGALTKKQKTGKASAKSDIKADSHLRHENSVSSKYKSIVKNTEVVCVDIRETQPMLAGNRSRFERLSGFKKPEANPIAMVGTSVNEEKENESPEDMLKRLETENRILKLQQENARIKEELAMATAAPPRHRQSYPSTYPSPNRSRSRFVDTEYSDYSSLSDERRNDSHNRWSYPPSRRERSAPRRSHNHHYRGNGEDYDEHEHGYPHRRYN